MDKKDQQNFMLAIGLTLVIMIMVSESIGCEYLRDTHNDCTQGQ